MPLDVDIVRHEIVDDKYTVYGLRCRVHDQEWEVMRRYSQFDKLHKDLRSKGPVQGSPPPKHFFGNLKEKVIKERMRGLQDYLKTVVLAATPEQQALLQQFIKAEGSLPASVSAEEQRNLGSASNTASPADNAAGQMEARAKQIVASATAKLIEIGNQNVSAMAGHDHTARQQLYRKAISAGQVTETQVWGTSLPAPAGSNSQLQAAFQTRATPIVKSDALKDLCECAHQAMQTSISAAQPVVVPLPEAIPASA